MRDEKKKIRAGFKVALLLLLWTSHQTEWRSKHLGSWMKDGPFPGMKAGGYNRSSVHMYTDHLAVFFCGQKHNLCIVHQHIQPSLFIWCRHSIFCFPKELCEEFLYLSLALFRYVCVSPSFSSSLLSSCLCPSCPISLLLLQVFSLSLLSIHPYVVGFATFIENH